MTRRRLARARARALRSQERSRKLLRPAEEDLLQPEPARGGDGRPPAEVFGSTGLGTGTGTTTGTTTATAFHTGDRRSGHKGRVEIRVLGG